MTDILQSSASSCHRRKQSRWLNRLLLVNSVKLSPLLKAPLRSEGLHAEDEGAGHMNNAFPLVDDFSQYSIDHIHRLVIKKNNVEAVHIVRETFLDLHKERSVLF